MTCGRLTGDAVPILACRRHHGRVDRSRSRGCHPRGGQRAPGDPTDDDRIVAGHGRGRTVALEAKRNLDVVRYQLVSDDHLVPRRSHAATRAVPPSGTACSAHATPAVTTCPRCTRPYCGACAPDGNHCSACLHALVVNERAAIKRLQRIGIGASLALTLIILVAGLASGSGGVTRVGVAGTVLVILLSVRMAIVISVRRETRPVRRRLARTAARPRGGTRCRRR